MAAPNMTAPSTFVHPILSSSSDVLQWARQACAVGGAVIGSRAALKRYIAVSALNPLPPSDTIAIPDNAVVVPISGRQRVIKALRSLFAFRMLGSWMFLGSWLIPKFASPTVQDALLTLVLFGSLFIFFYYAIQAAWPVQSTVQVVPSNSRKLPLVEDLYNSKYPHRTALAGLSAILLICAEMQGCGVLAPLGVGATVASVVSIVNFRRWGMGNAIGFMVGVGAVLSLLTGFVMLCNWYVKGSSSTSTPKPVITSTKARTSPSFMSVILIMPSAAPTIVCGMLCGLALRYDYSLTFSVPTAAPGLPVEVPFTLPSFPKPMFNTAIIALSTTLATLTGAPAFPRFRGSSPDMIALSTAVTFPVVVLAMFLRAWSLGRAREWWDYEEFWVPKMDNGEKAGDGAAKVVDDVEKGTIGTVEKPTLEER